MDPPSVEARPRRLRVRLTVPRQGDARVGGGLGGPRLEAQGRRARESRALEEAGAGRGGAPSRVALDRGPCGAREERIRRQDRKSTRLNSSHVSISYA